MQPWQENYAENAQTSALIVQMNLRVLTPDLQHVVCKKKNKTPDEVKQSLQMECQESRLFEL